VCGCVGYSVGGWVWVWVFVTKHEGRTPSGTEYVAVASVDDSGGVWGVEGVGECVCMCVWVWVFVTEQEGRTPNGTEYVAVASVDDNSW